MGYSPILDKKQVWVMTINKTFDLVTFWEAKAHKHYILKFRIDKKERPFLHNYLCPNITKEESIEIQRIREDQKNSLASLDGTKDDNNYDPLQGLAKSEEDDGDKDDDEEEEDEEQKKDSDFVDELSRVINLSDISQEFKDDDLNKIG